MAQWWDTCSDAGPKSREYQAFPDNIPDLETLSVVENELKHFGFEHSSALIGWPPKWWNDIKKFKGPFPLLRSNILISKLV